MEKDDKKLKGAAFNLWDINMALFGCGDPDMQFINDADRIKLFEEVYPKLNNPNDIAGKVIISGIGGNSKSEFWPLIEQKSPVFLNPAQYYWKAMENIDYFEDGE